jgi:hypothetical protein
LDSEIVPTLCSIRDSSFEESGILVLVQAAVDVRLCRVRVLLRNVRLAMLAVVTRSTAAGDGSFGKAVCSYGGVEHAQSYNKHCSIYDTKDFHYHVTRIRYI